jgi:hypothetical protein
MNEFYVVETEDDIFLGLIDFVQGGVYIRNGFAGHPKHVDAQDIVQMYPASMHPAVVPVNAQAANDTINRFVLAI